jgi:hypothetical protein
MPAKSFLGETREAAHRFYAMTIRGEVSDENIQAYMRAASQIQEIWLQIDERIAALQVQGTPIWNAYAQSGYSLAFIRYARAYQVFVQELLSADTIFDPQTVGYLPRITSDQANALCYQMQAALHDAVGSLHDPAYIPGVPFPLVLGPRIEKNDQPCPTTHFQGMMAAAREMREWAAGLIAQYDNAVTKTDMPIPPSITTHLSALRGRLAQADSHLRFGIDMAGQASQGKTPQHLHEETENVLWNALQQYFLLNQAIAMPQFLHTRPTPVPPLSSARPQPYEANVTRTYHDRLIRPDDLWRIASPSARQELRGTRFGTDEMQEMCEKMGGILSASTQQYLDEVDAVVARNDAYPVVAMANCPFEPIYRSRRTLQIAGATIPANYEFHWDFHRGYIEASPRFQRVNNWQECQQ